MNNLEIVNNEESKDNNLNKTKKEFNSNKLTIDNEAIPILEEMDINYLSAEQYYSTNYPEYKIYKCGNFFFIKMGNLLTFDFKKSNNYIPKFSIGPNWYLTIVLFILIFSLSLLIYNAIFKYLSFFKKAIFFLFIFSLYFIILCTALIHQPNIMNKKKNTQDYGFCNICKVYFNPYEKVEHCSICGVCFPKMDHHCVWMGKCVANKNTKYFYATLIDVGIFYIYIIYCVIVYVIDENSRKNKII